MIFLESGKINDYMHLVDIKQFGRKRVTAIYIAEFEDGVVIIDCGTALDVKKVLRYMKKKNISLSLVKYIIASHHHFDHTGGLWMLYDIIKPHNPKVTIMSSLITMEILANLNQAPHFKHAEKTFGGLMGELRDIPRDYFKIIRSDEYFDEKNDFFTPIDIFRTKNYSIQLSAILTPGHAPGHISIIFLKDGVVDFVYLGEAAGALSNDSKLISVPTSSAPDFNNNDYMNSLKKIIRLRPLSIGYCHFGVVSGAEDVREILNDNESIMTDFRNLIIKYYNEKPETAYVFEKIKHELIYRVNLHDQGLFEDNLAFTKLGISIIYGMMMDLGYR